MAEETKNLEVELDTDGVNEERVDIPEEKEPDESFAQKILKLVEINAIIILY